MKVVNKGHKKYLQAENLFEMAALAWVHCHPATKYQPGISRAQAFVAGIEWAILHQKEAEKCAP